MSRSFHILVFVATLLAYLSVYLSPATFWPVGFFALTIPFLLILNLLLLILYALRKRRVAIFPLLALLIGYPYITASVAFRSPTETTAPSFSVLNYNVRVFNIYAHLRPTPGTERAMLNWLVQEDADIKCLQEFYNEDSSVTFNTTRTLHEQGEYQSFVRPSLVNRDGAEFGLAIFSRFPILQRGEVTIGDDEALQFAIFADVKTPSGTVRIYNIHLRSMSIDENALNDQGKYLSIARKLKNGFTTRAQQVNGLLSHVQESPYPVVVCGDINDIPYSYSYFSLRHHLMNAFEEAGRGFGFSYNGKLFFLRIDNQFFSDALRASRFTTYQDVGFSDHFPVKAEYSFH